MLIYLKVFTFLIEFNIVFIEGYRVLFKLIIKVITDIFLFKRTFIKVIEFLLLNGKSS